MTEIETGCHIIQGKNICGYVIIGSGDTVIKDINKSEHMWVGLQNK